MVDEFRRGAFGIKRTSAKFARSPVDLTLEQTINADTSNQLTDNLAVDSISERLDSIIKAIKEAMDPFDDAIDKELLFNKLLISS